MLWFMESCDEMDTFSERKTFSVKCVKLKTKKKTTNCPLILMNPSHIKQQGRKVRNFNQSRHSSDLRSPS